MKRCPWAESSPLMMVYHDTEWGVPLHDERRHFEFLLLEAMQAGLSWSTILNKREGFRQAFADFDPEKVARFGKRDIARLLGNAAIIRNRLKIEASIDNAARFLEVQRECGSFDKYIWGFCGGKPLINHCRTLADIPVSSPLSDLISKDMKKRGFKFVGTTIIYANMQAIGMVNDHLVSCCRHREVRRLAGGK